MLSQLSYTPIRGYSLILVGFRFLVTQNCAWRYARVPISIFSFLFSSYFPASSFTYPALSVFFFFAISSSVG